MCDKVVKYVDKDIVNKSMLRFLHFLIDVKMLYFLPSYTFKVK